MKLHIENFAKIPRADIVLDGLTVIAGDNNTGKSTVGKILYALFRGQSNIDRRVRNERLKTIQEAFETGFLWDFPSKTGEEILAGTRTVRETLLESWNQHHLGDFLVTDSGAGDTAVPLPSKMLDALISKIEKQVDRARKMPADQVAWNIFLRVLECVFHRQYHPLGLQQKSSKLCLEIKGERNEITLFRDQRPEWSWKSKLFATARFISTPDVIGLLNVRDLERERKYTNVLDKDVYELACELVSGWGGTSLIEEAGRREDMRHILEGIDRAIGGEFIRDSDGAFGIREGGNAEVTRVENLSMGMKSLALLRMMVLRGALSRQDVLILDEPEVHLHPAWQLAYAQCIVRLQQTYELTVLVTTHSPYFLKALDIYSRKGEIADKTTFYHSRLEPQTGGCVFDDCRGDLNKIYQSLYEPYAELM